MSKRTIPIDATPKTHMLDSLQQGSNLSTAKCLAEIVDNSFDAKATRVDITTNAKSIIVEDNGCGCDSIQRMLTYGAHHKASSSEIIGRYGIGLKEASLALGSEMVIVTKTKNKTSRGAINWDDLRKSGCWTAPDAEEEDTHNKSTGTRIEFNNLKKRCSRQERSVSEKLQEMFTPALRSGYQITLNGNALRPIETPPLENVVTASGEFEGKAWRIIAGIIPRGAKWKNGFRINYLHRVIEPCTIKFGFGKYSGARVFVDVTLIDVERNKWSLARLKDGIDELEPLLESIYPYIEHLLRKSEDEEHRIELRSLEEHLTSKLNSAFFGALEKRPHKHGTKTDAAKSETGRKRQNAVNFDPSQSGSVSNKKSPILGLRVVFDWCGNDIGQCKISNREAIVYINRDFPFFKDIKHDSRLAEFVAITLLASALIGEPARQRLLPLEIEEGNTHEELLVNNISKWLGLMINNNATADATKAA